ncbi:hypothetical protein GLAREA_06439 [Glarea lozoyensis ATCC 20868]|uniref:Inner membrane assembly complex subunit 17 n=1 Tax=Glarea lozoyensis (strain ATCC 20868 / MF5171) TaxID=1116229 RepID=S3DMV0_GLAL2|nr:uncharacterized protein GLAREA_06439 [Glarea lozoyensis ATCC 20868]EPE33426.1 hypothetical protein GLAREA_06439 [Glarea lozoyensis ATCC 20868]
MRHSSPIIRQLRFYSAAQKPVSPHIGFYKTFSRPIAKVLLMATFTYQVAYWGWVKLEKDEEKAGRNAEIKALEVELQNLIKMAEDAGIKVKS